MGSRLVVAIRSETGWELYYDHWAAQTIGQDIAINGFEKTLKRVRAMVSLGDSLYECVKSTLIEGMLLIDMATKHVTWAEESDGLYMPRLINALVEHSWPGWTAIWSAESTDGVLQAADIDPADIFAEKHDATRTLEGSAWFGPWGDFGDSGVFSIRLDDGQLVGWRGLGDLDAVTKLGPDNMRQHTLTVLERARAGEPLLWDEQNEGAFEEIPDTGIHIDFPARELRWWSISGEYTSPYPFEEMWPGWTAESMGDNYEWQAQIIGRTLRSWADDVEECRQQLASAIDEGERPNPMWGMVEAMTEKGHKIDVYAVAAEFVPASFDATSYSALDFLDQLKDGAPLPPARIITRDGRIKPPLVTDQLLTPKDRP